MLMLEFMLELESMHTIVELAFTETSTSPDWALHIQQ